MFSHFYAPSIIKTSLTRVSATYHQPALYLSRLWAQLQAVLPLLSSLPCLNWSKTHESWQKSASRLHSHLSLLHYRIYLSNDHIFLITGKCNRTLSQQVSCELETTGTTVGCERSNPTTIWGRHRMQGEPEKEAQSGFCQPFWSG